jgi:hypothetical protein
MRQASATYAILATLLVMVVLVLAWRYFQSSLVRDGSLSFPSIGIELNLELQWSLIGGREFRILTPSHHAIFQMRKHGQSQLVTKSIEPLQLIN